MLSAAGDAENDVYRDLPALSRLVDDLGLFTFETFVAGREQIISDQADQRRGGALLRPGPPYCQPDVR